MKILASLDEVHRHIPQGCVATIGNFDGVHRGHQKLITRTVGQAHMRNLPSVAITFDPHPEHFFSHNSSMRLLMKPQAKAEVLASLGIDFIVMLPFTKALASQTPQEFVTTILAERLQTKHLVIGYDYAFGKGRAGNAAVLSSLGQQHGFTVEQLTPVMVNNRVVSSTSIRNALISKHLQEANTMLGRPFFMDSTVIHGKKRGSTQLGFPTANLHLPQETIYPHPGTYAVKAFLQTQSPVTAPFPIIPYSEALHGVANIGVNPTFGDVPLSVEVHLLDFSGDIYHTGIRVWFLQFLREVKKFATVPALIEQIVNDIETAQHYF